MTAVTVTAKNVICHTSEMAVSSYHHDPQKARQKAVLETILVY